jgi:HPt (histidine-containing phosphotransfer) domain-containing protein
MDKLLDWETALANADGSEELLKELVGVFLDEYPKNMQQIRAAIDSHDAVALRRLAHNLKGSARILAAAPAAEAALQLETMGADDDFTGSEESWAALGREVERLKTVLVEWIGRQNEGQPSN